ncbi:bifunctional precorrin-2 dehydrogenase/sirohydrochlorin ferrochelatase [bacterium]|nr:bifunctional precorrin-2 dehydrogenase/sirohydrochlorin ferrochelatase [bacterium]MBU1651463.1 bifunctional precorrin-2 dehydrogenase/sirohydrochlorin ferrochelatase [bacterium]MBU1881703.1 bifunctional precorrin-2 dehydrogenase/sirohydrochlorin ferrochelatase [bacterium]
MMPNSKPKKYLPLFFNIENQPCLVVGGGTVALRKVEQLLLAGAEVTIISPEVEADLQKVIEQGACVWEQRKYSDDDLTNFRLVIATTNQPEVNRYIYTVCISKGIPVNVVDQPELCTVIFPSIVRRGPITMAISSGGQTPFLTKALRKELENYLEQFELLEHTELLIHFRDYVQAHTTDFELKKKLYSRLLATDIDVLRSWSAGDPPLQLWEGWLEEENDG